MANSTLDIITKNSVGMNPTCNGKLINGEFVENSKDEKLLCSLNNCIDSATSCLNICEKKYNNNITYCIHQCELLYNICSTSTISSKNNTTPECNTVFNTDCEGKNCAINILSKCCDDKCNNNECEKSCTITKDLLKKIENMKTSPQSVENYTSDYSSSNQTNYIMIILLIILSTLFVILLICLFRN